MKQVLRNHGRAQRIGGPDPIPPGKWHTVGDVGEPAFENGWSGYMRFRLNNEGIIEVEGDPSGGTPGDTVFTLPYWARPPHDVGNEVVVTVLETGEVAISDAIVTGTVSDDLAAHLADTTDAHDASAISFSPTGTIASTDVQAAIAEVASEASPWEQIINKDGSTLTGFTQDSGSWVSSGGVISVDSTGGTARLACDTAYQNGNMIFKYDQRILSDGIVNNSRGGGLWNWDGSGAGAPHARFLYNTGGSERVDLEADSTTAVQNQDFAWTPDTWYTVTIIGAGQWFQVLVDGVFIVAGTIGHNGVASVGFKAGFQVTSAKADFRNMKLWVPALPS